MLKRSYFSWKSCKIA